MQLACASGGAVRDDHIIQAKAVDNRHLRKNPAGDPHADV
jgi:hypothetical protein